jgi:AAA domain
MRFLKLQVENFKAITTAELELGPGLNVLYGPNDLGKSTLGAALKAVLLLQSNSSAADEYQPWQDEVSPVVTLTFQDDTDKFWRVTKRFTENDATLSFSKDGHEFTVDAHERQVDEKLRKLLGWGIATPGGRTAPRGMPESFLANALLAAQTDVDAILRKSLEPDSDASGKVKLTAALSALAQDPLVRDVLDAARKQHELHYSATGKRRSGQSAPITLASDAVKKLTAELVEVQKALAQSDALEEESKRLHTAWLDAQQACEAVERRLKSAQAGLARATEKRAAQARLLAEREALAQLEVLEARVKSLEATLMTATAQVASLEQARATAEEKAKAAALAVREAEEALRKATSGEGEQQRAAERGELKEQQARATLARAEVAAQVTQAAEVARLKAEHQRVTAALGPARVKVSELQTESNLISGIMGYGAWREASDLAQQAERLRAEAQAGRADALKKTSEALALQQKAKAIEDEVATRRADLPDDTQRAALVKVRRELDLAEAALGGGVTVLVRPRSPLLLRSTADESPTEENKISREHIVEADRRVQVSIGDLVDLEVVAGAPEKRKDADALRKKWKTEGQPALERAGVRNVGELSEALLSLTETLEGAKSLRAQATKVEAEAKALRDRAGLLDEKAAGAPTAEQLANKQRLIGSLPVEVLEPAFKSMGANWEKETRPQYEHITQALTAAVMAVTKLENDLEVLTRNMALFPSPPGGAEGQGEGKARLAALERELATLSERLNSLESKKSDATARAAEALENAKAAQNAAVLAQSTAQQALDEARATRSAKQGERDALHAQLATLDRAKVAARVIAAQHALDAYADVELLSDTDRAALERAVDDARATAEQRGREYANTEGALSKVGGPQAREQVRQLEEALLVARSREHLLEVDAASWKLLVEAVRESEKEDSSSLGTALAAPVTARFAELTRGRYPSVKFDPSLKAIGLELPGTQVNPDQIIDALSVGTRDQLAMLVRLAIALQLKSAIVLDDHLVHTDLGRLAWFQDALRTTAEKTQVLVLTCRPLDYVTQDALPTKGPYLDRDGRRVIDLTKVIHRR